VARCGHANTWGLDDSPLGMNCDRIGSAINVTTLDTWSKQYGTSPFYGEPSMRNCCGLAVEET
jgi:hypothetical protein